jgi:thioesterase domain-containing protein
MRDTALNAGLPDSEAFLWQRLTSRPVRIHEVPGDHFTMMTGKQAETLARMLRESMDEVQVIRESGWGALSWALGH